jgi:hypothetical protein
MAYVASTKMEAAALKVLEIALAGTLHTILSKAELSEAEKGKQSFDAIQKCFDDANAAGTRLFFGPKKPPLKLENICHTVAIEELHSCYFDQCDFQTTMNGSEDRGVLCAVYGRKGMGKTYACLSLLAMKHSRAPRHGYFFSGATSFRTGDHYYNDLLDVCLGQGHKPLLSTHTDIFDPKSVAILIMNSLPIWDTVKNPPGPRRGILDIPGVRTFFQARGTGTGGAPVVVFDDVNIHLEPKIWDDTEAMNRDLRNKMGKAGDFFDMVMTLAYLRGIVVFVSTSNLMVAKFFRWMNDNTKAKAFKRVTDEASFTCQWFDWSKEKRLAFLKVRAEQQGFQIEDDILRLQAEEAYMDELSIREMDVGLTTATTHIHTGVSGETQDEQSFLCGGCPIM